MINIKKQWLLIGLICLLFFVIGGDVFAQDKGTDPSKSDKFEYDTLGNPLAKQEDNKATFENKSIVGDDFTVLSGRIAQTLVGLVGSAVFVMVVYGGLLWIFASGNEEKIGKAKKTLLWAIIGLVVVASAYAITSFTFSSVQNATQQKAEEGK